MEAKKCETKIENLVLVKPITVYFILFYSILLFARNSFDLHFFSFVTISWTTSTKISFKKCNVSFFQSLTIDDDNNGHKKKRQISLSEQKRYLYCERATSQYSVEHTYCWISYPKKAQALSKYHFSSQN
jgi:hypothetical protein